ncbi:MAG: ATP-dependent 6-phosphofructokinase [Phocaeicola sp.]|uniref:ATP-dependent 6-phosphofructokinase n=1 Tax=Phocaeicola sp. TaxID=2773926 RepID=UPI003FA09039
MKIGILTSGGDCPGLNAIIRGVCKPAIQHYGMEVWGIQSGFRGLVDDNVVPLEEKVLSGLLNSAGTVLGTSRDMPFKRRRFSASSEDKPSMMMKTIKKHGFDCIVCIGGNGTQDTAYQLSKLGVNVVTIPKTIDNDVEGTDVCYGFDSAVSIATDAIDRLHSTASAHQRVMVIEVMGHNAGWIALYSGMAGGGDIILIPELGYNIHNVGSKIIERLKQGKPYSIVVVAEGIKTMENKKAAQFIAEEIEYETGFETRETVLGYIQRGGIPTAYDRNLATRMGGFAAQLIEGKQYGQMVSLNGSTIMPVPLEKIAGKARLMNEDNDLIIQGKRMGICFG